MKKKIEETKKRIREEKCKNKQYNEIETESSSKNVSCSAAESQKVSSPVDTSQIYFRDFLYH